MASPPNNVSCRGFIFFGRGAGSTNALRNPNIAISLNPVRLGRGEAPVGDTMKLGVIRNLHTFYISYKKHAGLISQKYGFAWEIRGKF